VTRYLLDTNIVSDLIRHPRGLTAQRIAEVGEDLVCTSVIVTAELRFGAVKLGATRLAEQMEAVLARLEVLPFETPVDAAYADLRAALERRGMPIGGNDMLIAAHAMALGCTMVTDNVREFGRVEGLTIENWLRAA
jgi:tRNA(fMet)-specific endonuclease VapC